MKYTLETECAPCGFEEFANENGLELLVVERVMDDWSKKNGIRRYLAKFKDMWEDLGYGSCSLFADGNTPEEAIKMLQQKLLGKRLIYDRGGDFEPRRFVAPNEWK